MLLVVAEVWTAIEMAGTAQNGEKHLTFIVVPLLGIVNIKERWEKK